MTSILKESLPPRCDYITYLTIVESYLSQEILPTLNDILQDPELTQNIGWDLIHLLLPIPNSEACLITIAKYGNPREVILKVTEALHQLQLDSDQVMNQENTGTEPNSTEKFCTLVNLLSILHPRIKTKHPSRFLSTTLLSILATHRPSDQATFAIISFLQAISGQRRPSYRGRFSNLNSQDIGNKVENLAPDPEAQDEEPREGEIQVKLIQSFITHVVEVYVSKNPLDWAARFLEHLHPEKVVEGRSIVKAFREDSIFQARDLIVGQLMDLSRNFGLTQYDTLCAIFFAKDVLPAEQDSQGHDDPCSESITPSRLGTLLIATSFIYSSILLKPQPPLPQLSIFPDHARLVKNFIGIGGPELIGGELLSSIDAILLLGLWLESHNNFVVGPLEDEKFLQYLQSLSLLSANTPSPSLRYAAHFLCSSILHAHPLDRLRLAFITDTLENCPYVTLRASAVLWLKEEITTTSERNSSSIFASPTALAATQSFLFPATSGLLEASDNELIEEVSSSYPFNMAVLNFLVLLSRKKYSHILPSKILSVAEKNYLSPLKMVCKRLFGLFSKNHNYDSDRIKVELQFLEERLNFCLEELYKLKISKD